MHVFNTQLYKVDYFSLWGSSLVENDQLFNLFLNNQALLSKVCLLRMFTYLKYDTGIKAGNEELEIPSRLLSWCYKCVV